jgi:hypothetical protein
MDRTKEVFRAYRMGQEDARSGHREQDPSVVLERVLATPDKAPPFWEVMAECNCHDLACTKAKRCLKEEPES